MARRTGSRRNRHIRNLQHQKGTGITTQARPPLSSDGEDGDQMVVGQKLYIKVSGRWMPFRSGTGNINDGWHGSQRYVKILPNDFFLDNEDIDEPAFHFDVIGRNAEPLGWGNGTTLNSASIGVGHPGANAVGAAEVPRGLACCMPIPLGYWAIAAKIYASHTWGPSTIPVIRRTGANEGVTALGTQEGIQIHGANLEDGSSTHLTTTAYQFTNTRIVFDTALLGQNSTYVYIIVNGFHKSPGYPHTATDYSWVVYGGYIEIGRVQTAEALAEESEGDGGDVLARGG